MNCIWYPKILFLLALTWQPVVSQETSTESYTTDYKRTTDMWDIFESTVALKSIKTVLFVDKSCPLKDLICSPNGTISGCLNQIENITNWSHHSELVFCVSVMFCEPEDFSFTYIGEKHPKINRWKNTRVGHHGTPLTLCLQKDGLLLTRKCELRDLRAKWEPLDQWPPIVCLREFAENSMTSDLNDLLLEILEGKIQIDKSNGRRQIGRHLRSIVRQKEKTIQAADVFLISQIFTILKQEEVDLAVGADLVSVTDKVMASDRRVLRLSARLNATNVLLSKFEEYMDSLAYKIFSCKKSKLKLDKGREVETLKYSDIGVEALITGNINIFFITPKCDNITGIAIFSAPGEGRIWSVSGFWYRFLRYFDDVDMVLLESDLQTAVLLPYNVYKKKVSYIAGLNFKVYAHDSLFVEMSEERSRRPRSKVISISIQHYAGSLPSPLPFLLRNENFNSFSNARALSNGSGCGFWNYETWMSEGVTTSNTSDFLRDPIVKCYTDHITQFSFLIGGGYVIDESGEEIPKSQKVLDIISIVGCSLSLMGVFAILITAMISKKWRKDVGTKVLLHLCLAMSLPMALFVFINTDYISEQLIVNDYTIGCVALGAAMQYSVLVFFTWTLIIAWRQYQQLVKVLAQLNRPSHYVMKIAIVAWSLPLIPTFLEAFYDYDSYLPSIQQLATDTGICYPSGYGLKFGVVLPVALIIMINLALAVYSLANICNSRDRQNLRCTELKTIDHQIRRSIMLFFLLGLTWIFGVLAFLQAGEIFSYLFCITATSQGFVMFLYYVLLNKTNREAWVALVCPTRKRMNVQRNTTALQVMINPSANFKRRSHT